MKSMYNDNIFGVLRLGKNVMKYAKLQCTHSKLLNVTHDNANRHRV